MFSTQGLSKSYGRFKALDGLTMNVPKGSVYGFVGRNGAGKTTLMRVICGLAAPTGGGYTLYGADFDKREINLARRRMGAIIETPAIFPSLTARENLEYRCLQLGLPSFDEIDTLLSLVGLSGTQGKKAGGFSLGMRQRLGIASALAGSPDLLALDEPVNGLDPQGIVEVRELILRLNRERGVTVIVSSHILGELSKLATHYGFIDGGRMLKEISAEALEAACRRCMAVEVSDMSVLARVLEGEHADFEVASERRAYIYSPVSISKLVSSLSDLGCEIISISDREESLESYYINLTGGVQSRE